MRKNLGRFLAVSIVLTLLFAGSSVAVGQERVISEVDFMVYINRAFVELRNTPYRAKSTVEMRRVSETTWHPWVVDEYEYIRPDRMRWLTTYTHLGELEPSRERIHIAGKRFSRYRGQKWQVEEEGKKAPALKADSTAAKPMVEYKHLGSAILFNQHATIVQKTVTRKDIIDGKEGLVTNTEYWNTQYWFDAAGRFLQQEFLTHQSTGSLRQIIIYEYDPNIKVEAPIK
jgi:hypothetical protein